MAFLPLLHRVSDQENLSAQHAEEAMGYILEGSASTAQIAAFLIALRMKGETSEELLGFARGMRGKMRRVDVRSNGETLLDTCGTGGDGLSTFNISTLTAFTVAGAGVRVAKHGNRSISSQCGSADLLEALGIRLLTDTGEAARAIREVGIGFLFAPALHPAMKHAHAARVELKLRTAFNLLGPLTNPADANVQVLGAPSERAAKLMAEALFGLGTDRSFVVHGFDGMDEVTTTGPTLVYEVDRAGITPHTWLPQDFGIHPAKPSDLAGGGVARNLEIAHAILAGERGPARDIVLVNAAVALLAAGRARDLRAGMLLAASSLDSGAAKRTVSSLAHFGTT